MMNGMVAKYLTSPQGKQAIHAYLSSAEGQAAIREYLTTAKGKETAQVILPLVVEAAGLPEDVRESVRKAAARRSC